MMQDAAQELFGVADAAVTALAQIRNERIQKPLEALRKVCEQVQQAWSGSNLGYHATVYFAGLQPKPPNAEFSPEWGLMDRWPTHQPHAGWQTMDHQAVVDEIISRAEHPNRDSLESELASIRKTFTELKESATSILTPIASETQDSFLKRKLSEIEGLHAPESLAIEMSLISSGAGWSRDSLALTQGLRAAPHQCVVALPLSASALEKGIENLEAVSRQAASHIQRVETRQKRAGLVGANIFIGHGRSHVWRELKDFIEGRLGLPVDEFNSVTIA
jgi:hypothetical protein